MSGARFALLLRAISGAAAMTAPCSLVDAALVGAGITAAGASVAFAGLMFAEDRHGPRVNGLEYLAIFSQPSGAPKREAAPAPDENARREAAREIDMSPTGSIANAEHGATAPDDGFHLVAARRDLAWLRNGQTIRAVRPGDIVAGLGTVGSIVQREGEWALLDESGAPLIAGEKPGGAERKSGAGRFSKSLIFDNGAR
jgi:hypothetical protein